MNWADHFRIILQEKNKIPNQKASIQYHHSPYEVVSVFSLFPHPEPILSPLFQKPDSIFFNTAATRQLDCNEHEISWPRKELLIQLRIKQQIQGKCLSACRQPCLRAVLTQGLIQRQSSPFCTYIRFLTFPKPPTALSTWVTYLR